MNIKATIQKFHYGISWNGFLYVIQKIAYTALSFILFKQFSIQDFSLWANSNSFIFITLLWLDFGLRKSIPRYSPVFQKYTPTMKKFLRWVISLQITILICAAIILKPALLFCAKLINLCPSPTLASIILILFVIEGTVILLQIVFHSHFWQKQFNLIYSAGILLSNSLSIALVLYSNNKPNLLEYLFVIKVISGTCVIIAAAYTLLRLYKNESISTEKPINTKENIHAFIKHSAIMWTSTNLKSLSTRNIVVPIFTYALGPWYANIFKVANDGAILFYRTILKTIGTTDTSLLTYFETDSFKKKHLGIAFKKLVRQVTILAIPLFVVMMSIGFCYFDSLENSFTFKLFVIMATGCLLDLIFSPYERILEVKQNYSKLAIAYLPHIVIVGALIWTKTITYMGLVGSVIVIHCVRLVSLYIMACFVKKMYGFRMS
ncbi:hypothetical protein HN446_03000 [bacterium]|jgi:hypothetical protein|nr:hypothetical protein [bacterium]